MGRDAISSHPIGEGGQKLPATAVSDCLYPDAINRRLYGKETFDRYGKNFFQKFHSDYQINIKYFKLFSANTCERLIPLRKFATPNDGNTEIKIRVISSAGSEHLPYKQRVGGSNPSSPTLPKPHFL